MEANGRQEMQDETNKMEEKRTKDRRMNITFKVSIQGPVRQDFLAKIARNTRLGVLVEKVCKEHSLDQKEYEFLYEGQRLNKRATADELHMEDNGQIDVILKGMGGSLMKA